MAALWTGVVLLIAATASGAVHGSRRERRQAGGSCVSSEGLPGTCVDIRSCPALDQLLQNAKRGGSGRRAALNKLRQETFRCPFSRDNPLVCCESGGGTGSRPQQVFNAQQTTRRPTQRPVAGAIVFGDSPQFFNPTQRTTRRPQVFVSPTQRTTRRPQVFVNPARQTTRRPQLSGGSSGQPLLSQGECGRRTFTQRVIGGVDAEIGSWPWTASVGYRDSRAPGISWNCGATLITDRYLVTAAHCVALLPDNYRPTVVRLGELDFNREPDCLADDPGVCADPHQDLPIASMTPHPGYRGRSNNVFENDIALIKLSRSVRYTDFVRPICLPLDLSSLKGRSDSANGQKVYAVGWGRSTNDVTQSFTPILQEAELRVVPPSDCERTYQRHQLRLGSRLCVTGADRGVDTCAGDSGGPLMVPDQFGGRWYLTGVTSFGSSSCGAQEAVYTRVYDYIDWIRTNMS